MTTNLETKEQELLNAIQRVAEAAREASDCAVPSETRDRRHGGAKSWLVTAEDMTAIRDALKGWTDAGHALIRAAHEVNRSSKVGT